MKSPVAAILANRSRPAIGAASYALRKKTQLARATRAGATARDDRTTRLPSADPGVTARRTPIRIAERGNPHATRILVVGCIHGNECAGRAIVRQLAQMPEPLHADLWLLDNLNPDGLAAGTRTNARGVDLNRNFPSQWRPIGRRGDPEYAGPRPLSGPETRIAAKLILRLRPAITIWFHQPEAIVRAWGQSIAAGRRYAQLARTPFRRLHWPGGTAPNWQNHRFHHASSFVVELPAGPLTPRAAKRYARAVTALP